MGKRCGYAYMVAEVKVFMTEESVDIMTKFIYDYLKSKAKTRKNIKEAIEHYQDRVIEHMRRERGIVDES
tara:strand:+ start:31 stop:240 length:210 start_codon:yes stop_codon:yes gene_type:complete